MLIPSIITYQNIKTKKTIFHIVDFINIQYGVGSFNGLGLYVLDIQILYNGRFYSISDYDKLMLKETNKKNIFKRLISYKKQ